ncbi:MAG: extracellular solute-binding protein [Candidatus Cohnella colombiensis]|uniref:Extracellular solute-binding protein n=1 Tax=Candidatus Cohnella colombiensis TaxID=3121368 RepID=A0AA95EU55_9BACL|nr:MAG: extracellular solute-binding protein [Cohnella sp.]
MKFNRLGALLLIITLIMITAIGCSTKSKPVMVNAEITVLMADQGTSSLGLQVKQLFEKSKTYVEEKNPGLTVNIVVVPYQQYNDKIIELSPDVIWINPSDLDRLDRDEKVYDLRPLIESEGIDLERYFPPNIIQMNTSGEKLLGVTVAAYNVVVGYSKEWFDNAGLDYPTTEWTWTDFENAAVRLKSANGADSNKKYGAIIPLYPEVIETIAMSKGSGFLSPDGTTATGYLNSPQTIETVQWLKKLYSDGIIPDYMDAPPSLLGTQTGMIMGISPFINELVNNDPKYGMINLPNAEDGTKVSAPYITSFAITSTSEHPREAWTYISAVTLEDNPITREAFQMGLSISGVVFENINESLNPTMVVEFNQLSYAQKRSSMKSPIWGEVLGRYTSEFKYMIVLEQEIETTLTSMSAGVDEMLANARLKEDQ